MNTFDPGSWLAIAPQMVLAGTAFVVMVLHALRVTVGTQAAAAVIGIFASAFTTVSAMGSPETLTFPAAPMAVSSVMSVAYVALDGFAAFLFLVVLFVALATCLVAGPYLEAYRSRVGEFYVTVLLATTGMMIMIAAQDMLILYLGLEAMSLSAYVLAGLFVDRQRSRESALKYFLTGAFGSALFLYGVAFLYGATGTISLSGLAATLSSPAHPVFALVGASLLLCAFAFKVGAVPFHMWAPDVYQGAPTPVSGLMAVGVKAAAMGTLVRLVMVALGEMEGQWLMWLLYALSVATILWGNVAAVAQKNVKRLLAYSSVAHAGYLLIAVTANQATSRPAILLYLAGYAFMTLGAFAVVMVLERAEEKNLEIADYAGLARQRPYLAVCMAIFLLSLAGIPPTLGFVGKWYIFSSALNAGNVMVPLVFLAVIGSLVSVYYYMRLVYVMFMKEPAEQDEAADDEAPALMTNYAARVVAFGFAFMLIILGVFPQQLIVYARSAGLM
jgi:NADH-quinone oxidoreductase subunit N